MTASCYHAALQLPHKWPGLRPNRGLQARFALPRLARKDRLTCTALNIDRRRHMENAWKRQQQQEQLLSQIQPASITGAVLEVHNLAHLERVLEVSGGALCVLAFYSRSCGICKDVMADFAELWRDCRGQRARVVFMAHNVLDEYDYPSDVARYYSVRSVPRFLFLVDGAVVRQVGMADARQLAGNRQAMRTRMQEDRRLLRSILWELLVKNAPGARR